MKTAWRMLWLKNFLVKSELLYRQEFQSLEQFKQELVECLGRYNNHRIKAKLKGLPNAFYRQRALLSARSIFTLFFCLISLTFGVSSDAHCHFLIERWFYLRASAKNFVIFCPVFMGFGNEAEKIDEFNDNFPVVTTSVRWSVHSFLLQTFPIIRLPHLIRAAGIFDPYHKGVSF